MDAILNIIDWFRDHPGVAAWLFALSVALFFGSLVVMPVVLARMRPDYFVTRRPSDDSWGGRHRAIRLGLLAVKNLFGLILVVAGIAMLVLPGQGVVTIVVGISLLNFPGKRRLELRIVRQPNVRRVIDWIRERAGQPPLRLP